MYNWTEITRRYELACQCGHYAASADVAQRRAENGDDEAARWFERTANGEKLTWNMQA